MHMHIIVQCSGPSISQLVGSQSHFLFLFFSEPFLFLISSLFVPTLSMTHQSVCMSEHFEGWVLPPVSLQGKPRCPSWGNMVKTHPTRL